MKFHTAATASTVTPAVQAATSHHSARAERLAMNLPLSAATPVKRVPRSEKWIAQNMAAPVSKLARLPLSYVIPLLGGGVVVGVAMAHQ